MIRCSGTTVTISPESDCHTGQAAGTPNAHNDKAEASGIHLLEHNVDGLFTVEYNAYAKVQYALSKVYLFLQLLTKY